jgi:hypothetical protein
MPEKVDEVPLPPSIARKEFGRFSREQLHLFSRQLLSIHLLQSEWQKLVEEEPQKVIGLFTHPYSWSSIYTEPFERHMAIVIVLGGLDSWLHEISGSEDAQALVLADLQEELESLGKADAYNEITGSEPKFLVGAWLALIKSMESIWHYGLPLNSLVRQVEQGNDEALFKAVRIDRSIVSCSPIADRIARAEIFSDKPFFNKLRNALNGKSRKPKDEFGPLRYILSLLAEDGTLGGLSMQARYELICEDLGLYPDAVASEDPARSLHQFIRRWQKSQST